MNPGLGHVLRSDHQTCTMRITTAPTDESLARIIGLLTRRLWSVLELHHRRRRDHDEVELTVYKSGGRADLLLAALQREVVVIDVAAC